MRPITHAADQDRDSATASLESRHVAGCPHDNMHKARWIPACQVWTRCLPACKVVMSLPPQHLQPLCVTPDLGDDQHRLEHQALVHAGVPEPRQATRMRPQPPVCSLHALAPLLTHTHACSQAALPIRGVHHPVPAPRAAPAASHQALVGHCSTAGPAGGARQAPNPKQCPSEPGSDRHTHPVGLSASPRPVAAGALTQPRTWVVVGFKQSLYSPYGKSAGHIHAKDRGGDQSWGALCPACQLMRLQLGGWGVC